MHFISKCTGGEKMLNNELINKFNPSKIIANTLYIDESNKLWTVPQGFFTKKIKPNLIYKYSDILKYELLENNGTNNMGIWIKEISKCLQIKITLKDINNPYLNINLITSDTKKTSWIYKVKYSQAQEIISALNIIYNEKEEYDKKLNIPEQIEKYKKLLDSGAITKEEYNKKKNELLNMQ